jgi:hypothetical protein
MKTCLKDKVLCFIVTECISEIGAKFLNADYMSSGKDA